jgi:hypothetical protein
MPPAAGPHDDAAIDLAALERHARRAAVVRDIVRGVALGYYTCLYLMGRAGTGKTHTVMRTVEASGRDYQYFKGHLAPVGVFEFLEKYPDSVLILDDVASTLRSEVALQILLAATGRHPGDAGPRTVRYGRKGADRVVHFSGRIILISNLQLSDAPLQQAFKSRCQHLQYDPSEDEIAALMGRVARQGWQQEKLTMTPIECGEVTEHVIAGSRRLGLPLDMRVLVDKSYPAFCQYRAGDAETHWRDLVTIIIEQRIGELAHTPPAAAPVGRAARVADERRVAREITAQYATPRERMEAWLRLSGRPGHVYYRRLRDGGDDGPTGQ